MRNLNIFNINLADHCPDYLKPYKKRRALEFKSNFSNMSFRNI